MNYRHIYHAGNFADVVKHITLIALLQKLKSKDKPFAVLDAFAGLGLYNLDSVESQKTNESLNGIKRFIDRDFSNELLSEYIRIVRSHNGLYPGSPMITSHVIRENDRLIACELHEEDHVTLKNNMMGGAEIHHLDAYLAVKAFWPPKEKRGLILLDPPFEVTNEFEKTLKVMSLIKQRFSSGMTMLWYPIKDDKVVQTFYEGYKKIGYSETLILEFDMSRIETAGLQKCGLLISNPPDIMNILDQTMSLLAREIYNNLAKYSIRLL
ncbi:MAG: 23S rRNA (adenine(2030)-N(6))-methyltransferase RlmJ [Pseudomonadota bacterium]